MIGRVRDAIRYVRRNPSEPFRLLGRVLRHRLARPRRDTSLYGSGKSRLIDDGGVAACAGLSACANPYDPVQRGLWWGKGYAAPEIVYSPTRLRHPMTRTRPKDDPDPGMGRDCVE